MPSSISSSDRRSDPSSDPRLPQSSAWLTLLAALFGVLAVIAAGEWALSRRGYVPTAVDSEALWIRQRAAVAADPDAVVILGSSRAQIGIDLQVIAAATGRRTLQLAIDNTSFVPVLEGLAADPNFAGSVLVDYLDRFVVAGERTRVASAWEAAWQHQAHMAGHSPSAASEAWLAHALRSRLRLYADGAQPLTNLLVRALDPNSGPQYLVIQPDRSRLADYTQLQMPHFYYRTVARYLDLSIDALPWSEGLAAVETALREAIDTRPPPDAAAVDAGIATVSALARTIEARGGNVQFVRMPSCGLILYAEQRWYPRARFWDALAAANPGRSVHFEDYPELAGVDCPDGSHIDRKDVSEFTTSLWRILSANAAQGAGTSPEA